MLNNKTSKKQKNYIANQECIQQWYNAINNITCGKKHYKQPRCQEIQN